MRRLWEEWFKLAEEYFKERGDLKIPVTYITSSGEKLGAWISTQRIAYKNRGKSVEERMGGLAPLTDEQVQKLESIGMIWDVHTDVWDNMFKLAEEYYKEHGDLKISVTYITSSGKKLGLWITTQRVAYKNRGKPVEERNTNRVPLTDEQVQKLESIGMIWDVHTDVWDNMFKLAEEYYKEHGDLKISVTYITSSGEKLGCWIRNQRIAYKNRGKSVEERMGGLAPLTDEQVQKLESIGMMWDVYTDDWNYMFKLAEEYYKEHKEHGNLKIPYSYITSNGEKLGCWISTQRIAYKNRGKSVEERMGGLAPLTDEQVQKLESIGMIWDVYNDTWNSMFKLAEEYYREHGDLKIPQTYITSNGEKLGIWINTQRAAYKNRGKSVEERNNAFAPLTDEQVQRLEAIGMLWDVYTDVWGSMFKLAEEYYKEHGNLKIPYSYITSNGENLGTWIINQRVAYKNRGKSVEERNNTFAPLTDEQVQMLESIGMMWDVRKNKSDIEELCKNTGIDIKKNKDVIKHISLIEFKVKISYLNDNGMSVVDAKGLLHEIFSMSSMNMKLKYGVSLEDLISMYKEKSK